jgi:hypothetical protein
MKTHRFFFIIIFFSLLALHCSETKSLTNTEKAKLDRHLVQLLSGEQVDETLFDVQTNTDGTKLYAVIIRSNQSEEIKKMGIAVNSIFGDVIVARASIPQLRILVALPSVHAIQTGTINLPQLHN